MFDDPLQSIVLQVEASLFLFTKTGALAAPPSQAITAALRSLKFGKA
jgi:hypothetical protein